MRTRAKTGFGKTKSAALAAAMSGVLDTPDEDSTPIIIVDGIEPTAEGFEATVRVIFFTVEEERVLHHILNDKEEREIKTYKHHKEEEIHHKEIEKRHEEAQERWNRVHREAERIELLDHGYTLTPPEVMVALHTQQEFEGAIHAATHVHMHMTAISHDALGYSVISPVDEFIPDMWMADNDNMIRHTRQEEYQPEELEPILYPHFHLRGPAPKLAA